MSCLRRNPLWRPKKRTVRVSSGIGGAARRGRGRDQVLGIFYLSVRVYDVEVAHACLPPVSAMVLFLGMQRLCTASIPWALAVDRFHCAD